MSRTRHFKQRLSQRSIEDGMVDVLLQFGVVDGDKLILNRDSCLFLAEIFEKMKQTMLRMSKKGGVTIVEADNVLLTAYIFNGYKKGRNKNDRIEEYEGYNEDYSNDCRMIC